MTKRMLIMLLIAGVLFGGLFGFKAFLGVKIREGIAAKGLPAQTISTAKAQVMEWQGEFQAVGTLRAVRGADIAPEVPGVITAIHFQSGRAARATQRRVGPREASGARGKRGAGGGELPAQPEATGDPSGEPGCGGRRRGKPEERQGAGRRAARARQQEARARAL